VVRERWPEFDHIFVYDNATTHRKRSEGALSARTMPKSISGTRKSKNADADSNFLVSVPKRNADGTVMHDEHGSRLKEKIQMTGARFADGSPQDLYCPSDHAKHAGKFKGMEVILEERRKKGDLGDISEQALKKKNAECKPGFKCAKPD
ncbi:hypothetical protein FB45DRAFT_692664, partial [Roridomyces roridus]